MEETDFTPDGEASEQSSARAVLAYEPTQSRERTAREEHYSTPDRIIEDVRHPMGSKGAYKYWQNRITEDSNLDVASLQQNDVWGKAREILTEERFLVRRNNVMQRLAARLAEIDRKIDYPGSEWAVRKTVYYDPAADVLYVLDQGGNHRPLSPEEIAIELDWGNQYRPDPEIPETLWRSIRKHSDIAEARREIAVIFDEELSIKTSVSQGMSGVTGKWIEKMYRQGAGGINGVIGERMAKNTLQRLSMAHPELELRVENSNAVEDAQLKYDFKISQNIKWRGIATEPNDITRTEYVKNKRRLGIQFTVGSGEGKRKQIEHAMKHLNDAETNQFIKHKVDDIILVKLGLDSVAAYQRWLDEGKPPGGPEQYMTDNERKQLLEKVLFGMKQEKSTITQAISEKTKPVPSYPPPVSEVKKAATPVKKDGPMTIRVPNPDAYVKEQQKKRNAPRIVFTFTNPKKPPQKDSGNPMRP